MSLNSNKPSAEHDDLSFLHTLYHTSVKDIMEMDSQRIQKLVLKTVAMGHWLEGVHKLAQQLETKGH